jgi:hypothetical protein
MTTLAARRPRGTSNAISFALALFASAPLLSCQEEPVLDQLPLSAALDYVQRHPEYILANPEDHEIIHGELPRGDDAELDRRLAGDWVARTMLDYSDADVADRLRWARRSVEITRTTMLSQRSPGMEVLADDCVCERRFSDAAFARLVRGFSNCDGINHVLAMLLSQREPDTRMHHLGDSSDVDFGHTLAVMPGHDGPIFVDAWADFGLMVLAKSTARGVPTWDEITPSDAPDLAGRYARDYYERSKRVRKTELDYGPRHDQPADTTIPSDLPPITDARSAYLRARVFDLYGLEREALPLYEQAADMACIDPAAALCQLATVFVARSRVVVEGDSLHLPW